MKAIQPTKNQGESQKNQYGVPEFPEFPVVRREKYAKVAKSKT